VGLLVVRVVNLGEDAAVDATPAFVLKGEDFGQTISWLPESFEESKRIEIRAMKEVDSDPDEIADFLRREYFVLRHRTLMAGQRSIVVIALMVEGGKLARIAHDLKNGLSAPVQINTPRLSIATHGYRPSIIQLETFKIMNWHESEEITDVPV
jgi:hypothetical protein